MEKNSEQSIFGYSVRFERHCPWYGGAGLYRRFLVSADQFSLYLIYGAGCLTYGACFATQVRRGVNERGALNWTALILSGLALTLLVCVVALI